MRSMLACLKFVTVLCRAEVHDCLHVFVLSRVFVLVGFAVSCSHLLVFGCAEVTEWRTDE